MLFPCVINAGSSGICSSKFIFALHRGLFMLALHMILKYFTPVGISLMFFVEQCVFLFEERKLIFLRSLSLVVL